MVELIGRGQTTKQVTMTSPGIEVNKSIDGRIILVIGRETTLLKPSQAIKFAKAILEFCGVRLDIGFGP